jgi:hypothetical protein
VSVKPQVNVTFLVGLIASERGALSLISAVEIPGPARPQVLIDLSVDELTERSEGLRSFDALILNDTDTSALTPGQRTALEAWVQQGGSLVIGGGAGARRTASGLPESLLPVVPRRQAELDTLPGLSAYVSGSTGGEPVRVPGPFLAALGDVGQGQTLADQEGLPLVRKRTLGDGSVTFVALDLAHSPFDAWAGTVRFWEKLIIAGAAYAQDLPADLSPRQMRSNQMTYALSNMPSLALPSVRRLSTLLTAYILLVGPVNYLVLRWRNRLHWAWITIPALTLLFSGGAFGLAYALRGTDLIVNQVAIVTAQANGAARVDSYVGLFSPARQSYEVEVQGETLLSAVHPDYDPFGHGTDAVSGEVHFVQGNPGQVRGLTVNQWSMQTFMAEGMWPDLGQVESALRFDEGALIGTVHNRTQQALQDVVIVIGNQYQRLGDLAPGAEAQVRLAISDHLEFSGPPISYRLFEEELSSPGPGGPPKDVQLKQHVLDSVLNSTMYSPISSFRPVRDGGAQELTLLAWFDSAPPEVRVAGRQIAQRTTALLLTPLTYDLASSGVVSVPPGFVPGNVLSMPVEGGPCGPPGVPAVYINQGAATFEFELPESARQMQIDRVTLALRSEGGWQQPPQVAVYDWSERAWKELDDPVVGDNVLPNTPGLLGDGNIVRARLSLDTGSGGGCYHLGLGFEGRVHAGGASVAGD